jgi:uncharacterized protein
MEYREFRAGPSESEGKLTGIAAPFSSETVIGDVKRGGWREEIAPGAFKKALAEGDTVLLCDHDMSKPLARVSAGTLELRETKSGLEFEGTPAPTSYAQDLLINVRAGNKGGMSIGFDPVKDEWFDDQGRPSNRHVGTRRILREVRLPEVSCVTNPAYKDTTLMARDALLAERESRALEHPETIALAETLEGRASSISAADRRKLAAKGHALPDGSYPIPDVSHLHAAAILAASKHGDYKAAKRLIRRRAKELGVDVTSLPGFGKKSRAEGAEQRIKKSSAKRVLQIDAELKQAIELFKDIDKLPEDAQRAVALVTSAAEHAEHIAHKEDLGGDDLSKTSRSEQEPESSTSANDDPALALRALEAARLERSRELDPSEA